jgi:hypothetical protein
MGERTVGCGVSFTAPLLQPVSTANKVATARSRERMLPFLRKSISLARKVYVPRVYESEINASFWPD